MLLLLMWFLIVRDVSSSQLVDITQSRNPYLLPRTIVPSHYDLNFRLHVSNCFRDYPCNYDGTALIQLQVLAPNLKDIFIHSGPNIFIKQAVMYEVVSKRQKSESKFKNLNKIILKILLFFSAKIEVFLGLYNNQTSIQNIRAPTPFEEGHFYILSIDFESEFSHTKTGFYKSSYFYHGASG